MKKKIIIGSAIVIIIGIIGFVNYKRGSQAEIKVQTDKVKRQNITQVVSASGKVKPQTEVKISANVTAKIIELPVKEGDPVHKGQLLVRLERTQYDTYMSQARADLASANATLAKTKAENDRVKELFAKHLASQAELEISSASYEQAKSVNDQAHASYDRAADNLAKCDVYSPMDGTVSLLNSEVGENVMGALTFSATEIMRIADLSKMEVKTDVDENDVVNVTVGDTASVEVDAIPKEKFKGTVSEIANTATSKGLGTQEEVVNFAVKVQLLDPAHKLRPGMSATVDIATETHKNVLSLPIQSVTVREPEKLKRKTDKPEGNVAIANDDSGKKQYKSDEPVPVVFVLQNGVVHPRPVKTGISNDTHTEITEGLQEGEEIVIGPYRILSKTLKDADRVKVDNTGLKIEKKKKKDEDSEE
jgi:HlyD family secretion protein